LSDQSPAVPQEGVGLQQKYLKNPTKPTNWRRNLALADAGPRCGAQARSGRPCRAPGMPNGRCRVHGGWSTGPKTAAGLARIVAARTKHGRYSAEARMITAIVREMRRESKRLVALV
jgi:hypothetical protein